MWWLQQHSQTLGVLRSQHVNIWKPRKHAWSLRGVICWETWTQLQKRHQYHYSSVTVFVGTSCFLVCLSLIEGWFPIDQFIFATHFHSTQSLTQPLAYFPPESPSQEGHPHSQNLYFQRVHGVDEWWKSWVTFHQPHHCSCLEPTSRCAKTGCDWTLTIKGLQMRQRCVQVCGYFWSFIRANFLPHSVVFSRLCCLWWTISDVLIAAVGTNYCMQIWACCHFWAASLCHCCQLVVSLLKRHFTVSQSACDENPWLALRNCLHGLMFLSKMWALMQTLFLGFRGKLKMGDLFE